MVCCNYHKRKEGFDEVGKEASYCQGAYCDERNLGYWRGRRNEPDREKTLRMVRGEADAPGNRRLYRQITEKIIHHCNETWKLLQAL